MKPLRHLLGRLVHGLSLLLGVSFLSFLLMVHFGPDRTYLELGKNADQAQVELRRQQLGYDQPLLTRYVRFVSRIARGDFGHSDASGERVGSLLSRALPVTLALVLPGFVLGNLLGLGLGLAAAWYRGRWPDRLLMGVSVLGMSISFLVIIIVLQVLLCTPWGLDLFPARGWEVDSLGSWLLYVTVPTLALVLVTLGYNTRFYRAVLVEELGRAHILTVRALGATPGQVLLGHVLRNSLVPILTRTVFTLPLIVVSGSLLLETYFGIPGVGRITYDATVNGDQPVLLAVVTLTASLFILLQAGVDLLYGLCDPRLRSWRSAA